ncbi:unnamed protein product [Scytosiphon promiscuus]
MASPVRQYVQQSQQQYWSGSKVRRGGAAGGQQSPSPAKARQAQRRYRSLFHQAAKEYWAWREGEDDSQRALGSVFHLLDRLRMLEPSPEQGSDGNLGGLEHLPGCRQLLIRKHTIELERVMRLWRALVQQMRSQVSRVEESLAEAWQLHRSDAGQALRPLHHSPPSRQLPPPHTTHSQARENYPSPLPSFSSPQQARGVGTRPSPAGLVPATEPQQHSRHFGAEESGDDASMPASRSSAQEGVDLAASLSPRKGVNFGGRHQQDSAEAGDGAGVDRTEEVMAKAPRATAMVPRSAAGELATTATVGPAEYLQWLGDMTSMLVHEQWRKEELLALIDFGPEATSVRARTHVQANWSSRSIDSFLDQKLVDAAIESAQVVPPSKTR